jgi:Flp pilus assembly pilin Flp
LVADLGSFRLMRNKMDAPCRPVARIGRGRLDMLKIQIQLLRAALRSRAGVSSIEYGILAVGIIAAVTAAMAVFSSVLAIAFGDLGNLIEQAF